MKTSPNKIPRTAALAVLLAVAGPVIVTTASAQAASVGGISLEPVGKPSLAYTARPGSVVEGAVLVKNTTKRSHEMRLTPVDVGTASVGGALYGNGKAGNIGTWVTLSSRSVTVGPRSVKKVSFRVRVPSNAQSGTHFAGITAVDPAQVRAARTTRDPKARKGVVFHRITRFALPIKLRVPGKASPRLEFRGASISNDAVGTKTLVSLENTGRTLIRKTAVDLRIKQGSRTLVSTRQGMQVFVPDSKAGYPVAWPFAPKPGEYRLVGQIRPAGAPVINVDTTLRISDSNAKKAERSLAGRTTTPDAGGISIVIWLALGGVTLAALAFGLMFVLMRRRLKEATEQNRDGR